MTADCVADSWLRAIKTDAWTMTTYTSPLCSVPAIFCLDNKMERTDKGPHIFIISLCISKI